MSEVAKKRQAAIVNSLAKELEQFYGRCWPGEETAPPKFWDYVLGYEDELREALDQAGPNVGQIRLACATFKRKFKALAIKALEHQNGKQHGQGTGARRQGGRQAPDREAAGKAVEDPQRPQDYVLW